MGSDEARGLTLDAGALIAYETGAARARALLRAAADDARRVTVPTVALAQVWRGAGRRSPLPGLIEWVAVEPFDLLAARRAGELLARAATSDVVDAAVAVSAATRGDIVLTSDPDDLLHLAAHLPAIRVLAV